MNVADVLLDLTHGGQRDYRTTEAQIAAHLPRDRADAPSPSASSATPSTASAAGLVDWDHGTSEEFYDDMRRTLLSGRWQGPPTYRLLIPTVLHQHILESEAAAKTRTWRDKNRNRPHTPVAEDARPSPRELDRRRAQSDAAALARAASTPSFQDGLDALDSAYGHDPELLAVARRQFEQSWMPRGPT